MLQKQNSHSNTTQRLIISLSLIFIVAVTVVPLGSIGKSAKSSTHELAANFGSSKGTTKSPINQDSTLSERPNLGLLSSSDRDNAFENIKSGIKSDYAHGENSSVRMPIALVATPSISSISPSSPTVNGSDQNVTIFGSGFQSNLTVTIGFPSGGSTTLSGTQIRNVTSTSFVMVATLSATGTWNIRVNNPDGGRSNTFFFTVQSASPTISSISPSTPTANGRDQNVTVFGSNFQQGLSVSITFPGGGGTTLSGTQIQNVSSSSFVMVATLGGAGTWSIRVNNPNGSQSNTFFFTVQSAAPAPQINSISPLTPSRRDNDQSVSVFGNNFQSGLTVTVFIPGGGTATLSGTQIQNVNSTSFTMLITLNVVGTYGVRVNNPSGGQSNTYNFQVQNPISTPQINSLSPSSPTRLNGDQSVSVFGSGYQSGLTVTVFIPGGGTSTLSGTQIQNVNSTSFTMVITLNVAGNYGIRVNNLDGGQSNTFNFSVQNPVSSPQINSITPFAPTRRDSDQNVSVIGSGFQQGLTVTVFIPGGASVTLSGTQIQSVNSSSFTMIVTLNVAGTYGIRVNNPDSGKSNTFNFNVQNPISTPQITAISPTSPTRNDSDQNVMVSGGGFQSNLTVTVFIPGGGTSELSGTQIQTVAATSFTMIIKLNVVGQYGIRVNNPDGGQSNIFNFNVRAPTSTPQLISVSPTSPIRKDTDQNVAVTGSGFQSGMTITVFIPGGGTSTLSGTQIQNLTSNSFTMIVTLNVAGQYGIRVNNPDGGQSNTLTFQVQNQISAPQISSINPTSPTASNIDQNVTVVGNNFQQNLTVSVTFPGGGGATLSGTQIQNVTTNSFVMRITLGRAGNWGIRVNNPDGGQSNTFTFDVQSVTETPAITSLNPSSPFVNSSDQDVVVFGSNFQPNLTVSVTFPGGGSSTLSGTQIQNVTPTSFVARITLGTTGNWAIRINNPDGGQSNTFNFNVLAGGQNPVINSINPATPVTNGADQNVIVNGSNFQTGLRVDVSFPDGGVSTLQGTGQIQNVMANSFLMRITLNGAGGWTMRVINPDGTQSERFNFNVQPSGPPSTNLPASVLSPVIGPLRMTTSNLAISDGKWEFNQYKSGFHTPTGGISLSNDTFAWDINLYTPTSGNADAGKAVFAVADGEVVSYVGTPPGGGLGAVLIAHPNSSNPVWFSGYLHMVNVRVSLDQQVNSSTVLGEIGRAGANNDHLHFVIYSGQNRRGDLVSFNATVVERSASAANPPTIDSISPNTVTQSNEPQIVTINGSNFQANSIIEAQAPNGQYFTILPEPISASQDKTGIVSASSTSITASIPFVFDGTYTLSVINRPLTVSGNKIDETSTEASLAAEGALFAVSTGNTVNVSAHLRKTPVIIIPGIMGSRLAKRNGNSFDEIFPSLPYEAKHIYLKDFIGYGNPIGERPIVATDILKEYLGFNVYGTLIDTMTGPYRGYKLYRVNNPIQRTLSGCDLNQKDANLFVFPYDWRSSNQQSAQDLKGYIDCIKKIHDPGNTNPGFKVNIIAHSMGGLVARRYILEGLYGTTQNYDPKVGTLITLGTPWLGAPKFILALEEGDANTQVNLLLGKTLIKYVVPYMPGAHELIPSRSYTDELRDTTLGDFPFGEDGWDFNGRDQLERMYSFGALERIMNRHRPPNTDILPGTNTDVFHNKRYLNKTLQDNWTGDNTGVTYYNFVGRCLNNRGGYNTVGSIIATNEWYKDWLGIWREKKHLVPKMTRGDCTVPEISAMRQSSKGNYLGPAIPKVFENVEHGGLPNDSRIISTIDCIFAGVKSETCFNRASGVYSLHRADEIVDIPAYNLSILGSKMVSISDSFGNTTRPLSSSYEEGVATVSTTVTGEDFLHSVIPLDQNYKVVIRTSASPLVISVTKNHGADTTLAIRYLDLPIPPDVLALLEITPQGVSALRYDSDGDGTFDTSVNPTVSVIDALAQDVEAPVVTINETVQNGSSQVVIGALDSGTGVKRIMYSVNGTNYQPYVGSLTLNPLQTPVVYAFADDNVANRSGLVTYNLAGTAPSTAQFSAADFSFSEGAGHAAVTVNRSGSTTNELSVTLLTIDDPAEVPCDPTIKRPDGTDYPKGTAYARCDYATTIETLTWAAGDSQPKTINIPIIDDSHIEGNETLQLKLLSSASNSLGAQATATLTIAENDATGQSNPILQTPFFVRMHYLDFLSREPEVGEPWSGVLGRCGNPFNLDPHSPFAGCDRLIVSQSFFGSPEFRLKGFFVYNFYRVAFNRRPEYAEIIPDMRSVTGETPTDTYARRALFPVNFTERPDFKTAYSTMSNTAFINTLLDPYGLQQITAPDPQNPEGGVKVILTRTDLINRLGATSGQALNRSQVLRAIVESDEVVAREYNGAFVAMQYYGYLRRTPEEAGFQAWLRVINEEPQNVRLMVNGFMNSNEYRLRFGRP